MYPFFCRVTTLIGMMLLCLAWRSTAVKQVMRRGSMPGSWWRYWTIWCFYIDERRNIWYFWVAHILTCHACQKLKAKNKVSLMLFCQNQHIWETFREYIVMSMLMLSQGCLCGFWLDKSPLNIAWGCNFPFSEEQRPAERNKGSLVGFAFSNNLQRTLGRKIMKKTNICHFSIGSY